MSDKRSRSSSTPPKDAQASGEKREHRHRSHSDKKEHHHKDHAKDHRHRGGSGAPEGPLAKGRSIDKPRLMDKFSSGEEEEIECEVNVQFDNWGRTVQTFPAFRFYPKTQEGIQNIVKFAEASEKSVRCSGFKHSWSSVFASSNDIWISMLPHEIGDVVPAADPPPLISAGGSRFVAKNTANTRYSELMFIEIVDREHYIIKVGSATTNEQFRAWAIEQNFVTLPLNVIMVEITLGGSNAPMCHGAGFQHETLSDLVVAMEVVTANGELKTIEGEPLRAMAGALGLGGVVISLTLQLEKMRYAKLAPKKEQCAIAVPPPFDLAPYNSDNHRFVSKYAKHYPGEKRGYSVKDFTRDKEKFKQRLGYYYSEFFWFPFQKKIWVNCWNCDDNDHGVVDYPSKGDTHWQEFVELALEKIKLPGLETIDRAKTFGDLAMGPLGLPKKDGRPINTYVIDGLHFRRGIHNMRVHDMEVEIPIPAREDDPSLPDDKLVRLVWWTAITLVEEWRWTRREAPMMTTLEMRIMAGSKMLLAPERGNKFTCSIEVLTFVDKHPLRDQEENWYQFSQQLLNRWVRLVPDANVRLHWAKEWEPYNLHMIPMTLHNNRIAYAKPIAEFVQILNAHSPGFERRFCNPMLSHAILGRPLSQVVFVIRVLKTEWNVIKPRVTLTLHKSRRPVRHTSLLREKMPGVEHWVWEEEFRFEMESKGAPIEQVLEKRSLFVQLTGREELRKRALVREVKLIDLYRGQVGAVKPLFEKRINNHAVGSCKLGFEYSHEYLLINYTFMSA